MGDLRSKNPHAVELCGALPKSVCRDKTFNQPRSRSVCPRKKSSVTKFSPGLFQKAAFPAFLSAYPCVLQASPRLTYPRRSARRYRLLRPRSRFCRPPSRARTRRARDRCLRHPRSFRQRERRALRRCDAQQCRYPHTDGSLRPRHRRAGRSFRRHKAR